MLFNVDIVEHLISKEDVMGLNQRNVNHFDLC